MDSIKILVHEHDNILRMLDVMHQGSLCVLNGDSLDIEDFKSMVSFVRNYADKIHHGKEEKILFTKMIDQLGRMGDNLIRHGMMVEHDIGRLYISDLDAALDAYAIEQTSDAKLSVLVAAGSYEQLLRRHIQKENTVVFPFGEKKLGQEALNWIEEQTQSFESHKDNVAEREHQLTVLETLEKKYL